jgi:hypothetical protein
MNRLLLALGGLAVLAAGPGYAQQVLVRPGDAAPGASNPCQELAVTPAVGPWMIMIKSFQGEPAPQLAHDFALELRNRYRLPAYVFIHGAEEKRREQERVEQQRQQQRQWLQQMGFSDTPIHVRRMHIEEQYAVLVGGYKDFDAAADALQQIKKQPPPSEQFQDRYISATAPEGTGAPDPAAGSRPQAPRLTGMYINPFPTSFVVHNPTVSVEHQQREPEDYDYLKKINAGESYSLLNCRKPWTLVIKQWPGQTVVVSHWAPLEFVEQLFGQQTDDYLDAGAKQAHELAGVMRQNLHLETYVLHMRYASLLTVGEYDSLNDPELLRVQRELAGLTFTPKGMVGVDPNLKMFDRPLPMRVPQPQ